MASKATTVDLVETAIVLARESSNTLGAYDLRDAILELSSKARALHRYYELACERNLFPSEASRQTKLELDIQRLAEGMGFTVKFVDDPRGAPVKLILPSGRTNDWGQEGWCVPF